jgi:hypothetical protein
MALAWASSILGNAIAALAVLKFIVSSCGVHLPRLMFRRYGVRRRRGSGIAPLSSNVALYSNYQLNTNVDYGNIFSQKLEAPRCFFSS